MVSMAIAGLTIATRCHQSAGSGVNVVKQHHVRRGLLERFYKCLGLGRSGLAVTAQDSDNTGREEFWDGTKAINFYKFSGVLLALILQTPIAIVSLGSRAHGMKATQIFLGSRLGPGFP